jgi:NitT/TauT family transport system permease protein
MTPGRVRMVVAPVVFGVLALVAWQLLVTALQIKPFVLPGPLAIGQQFGLRAPYILQAALITALNALLGLVVGTVLAVVAAVIAAALRVLDELSAWIVTALSVVPIVALAPVLYTMFGASVQTARILVAAIAVFVPVYVTTLRGLRTVLPIHRDLMRAYAASAWQATRAVTLPGAVPYFFTGLRIASSLAVISALVAEYFGGPFTGLGKSITSAVSSSDFPLAWAFVLGAILTGLVFYLVTLGLEVALTAPHAPRRGGRIT